MPAETHSHAEDVDVTRVLDLLCAVVGMDPDGAADRSLVELGLDDDLAVLDLWSAVAEELGERSLGDLELPDRRPATVGELAELFLDALGWA